MSSAALSAPAARLAGLRQRLRRLVDSRPAARYAAAALLVLACLAVRLLLAPAFTTGYGYTCFYPAVILATYLLGAGPGVFAAVSSATLVYFFLGLRPLDWQSDARGFVILGFFIVSSAIAIYVLGEIRGQLRRLSESHERAQALAVSQADLFRDHAERVTNHLQLIAAILQLQARSEDDQAVSRVLTNAASRTLLISRMHREFAGAPDRRIDFQAFAHRLVEAAAAAGRISATRMTLSGDGLQLPLEHATALGLVLLESLAAADAGGGAATLEVELRGAGEEVVLRIDSDGGDALATRDMLMLEAVAEQLRGRLLVTRRAGGGAVQLTFPAALQPPPAWEPLAQALH